MKNSLRVLSNQETTYVTGAIGSQSYNVSVNCDRNNTVFINNMTYSLRQESMSVDDV